MDLDQRMKLYEQQWEQKLIPLLPALARIDGRCFHSWTRNMERPYDKFFHNNMVETTKYLVEETNALLGYTQSDEVSLLWHSDDIESQIFFDGRVQKMCSILSALTSSYFQTYYLSKPIFDARVWNVPNKEEVANYFIWRQQDATRNSIQMATRSVYSHKQVDGKNTNEMQDMLFDKGINWNDYPTSFKRGTFVQRKNIVRAFTVEELQNLPEKHEAKVNPNLKYVRTQVDVVDFPILTTVDDRVGLIYGGQNVQTSPSI